MQQPLLAETYSSIFGKSLYDSIVFRRGSYLTQYSS